ncbi:MAG: hypothetical protein WCS88_03990 [Patescibacteria group bacterium]
MEDLIAALTIFAKYTKSKHPTNCEHDELRVQVDPRKVSREDKRALAALGFDPDEEVPESFISFRFGSC